MLWRTYLLNRLIGPRDIRFIVGRHPVVYAKVLIQYTAVFLLLFLLRRVIHLRIDYEISQMVFGVVTGILYLIGVFMILRQYFDVMVGTPNHLYIVLWDSFFKYTIKIITRNSIQDISVIPAAGIGIIRKDANIRIATEQDDQISFNHVYDAIRVASNMYDLRSENKKQEEPIQEDDQEHLLADDEKFKVLVETLGEVIVDYMKKKE